MVKEYVNAATDCSSPFETILPMRDEENCERRRLVLMYLVRAMIQNETK